MRILIPVLAIFLLSSCDFFLPREEKTRKKVLAELNTINWNDVDQYPLFEDCDESATKTEQRGCFEDNLLAHFAQTLSGFEFELEQEVVDTIFVDFLIERDGSITVLEIEDHPLLQEQIPEFNGVITQSLKSLPRIEPALKRGMPVSAKFRIPLELNTK